VCIFVLVLFFKLHGHCKILALIQRHIILTLQQDITLHIPTLFYNPFSLLKALPSAVFEGQVSFTAIYVLLSGVHDTQLLSLFIFLYKPISYCFGDSHPIASLTPTCVQAVFVPFT